MFPLELLQAINDWQIGTTLKRAETLKVLSAELPNEFKTCRFCCFRQVALDKAHIWKLGEELFLEEKISSWTHLSEVAKTFKGGVPPPKQGFQGVIFSISPPLDTVIINLEKVYSSDEFKKSLAQLKHKITRYHEGIGRYGDSQSEVILEIEKISINDVHALGGHSSSREELAEEYFGHKPTTMEQAQFDMWSNQGGAKFGADWIENEAKDRVLKKVLLAVEKLQPYKTN